MMRLSAGFYLLTFIGFAWASVEALVYTLQEDNSLNLSETPILSLKQAKFVLAQRLGVSNNYDLGDACDSTLLHINKFGGTNPLLFENPDSKITELVMIVEGKLSETTKYLDTWPLTNSYFRIRDESSLILEDLIPSEFRNSIEQVENRNSLKTAINPRKAHSTRNSKIIQLDVLEDKDRLDWLKDALLELRRLTSLRKINAVIILIPKINGFPQSELFDSESHEKILTLKRRTVENSILSTAKLRKASNYSKNKFKGLLPPCFNSLDTCISSTNNCSGHGECISKYGKRNNKGTCFSCKCGATNETVTWAKGSKKGWRIGYWGGAACHKEDVSSAFWLISAFTILMLGIITWGISMLFSIGNEKLPGVIGAGVTGGKSKQSS